MEQYHQDYEAAATDTYINAHLRGNCRRKVSDEFFGNRPASPSLACSNENCPRCVVTASRLCCDTCNPGSFILPVPATAAPKQTRAPNRFKVDTGKSKWEMADADLRLTSALRDWRDAELVRIGIPAGDDMYGSQLIMTDDLLERLVELAHFNQLTDLASLKAQVNWRYIDMWGTQILELIKEHAPGSDSDDRLVAPPNRATLHPTGADNIPGTSTDCRSPDVQSGTTTPKSNTSDPKPRNRKGYKCSACGSSAHIGMPEKQFFIL
ncbi:hypothetical protein EDB85DRAFT_2142089 [Lactarius pseudohatsudake]|nr:hypothetical protein EDB85DRAFT_2142089 [Lactarius pseudohatsudake]